MGDVSFSVELRDSRGKGAARELRRRGMVPGIVYGGGKEATAISLDALKFDQMIKASHAGLNTLIDLEGAAGAAGKTVIAKELQREAVRGGLTHVDLYEVDLTAKMEVMVPIHLTGTPAGVVLGGVLDQQQRERGAVVNEVHNDWWTPLSAASWNGHTALARMLRKRGATVPLISQGLTPGPAAAAADAAAALAASEAPHPATK